MNYQGDYKEDSTVYVMFNTFTSDDPSASSTITNLVNTDVHIHKEDDLTQRNNAAGITVSVNFDSITGSHMIKIDTNDNTVAGFWVTGKDYFVRIEGTTVDGATINAVVGHFSIENRHNEVDLTHIMGTILTEGAGGRLAAALIKLLDVATPVLTSASVNQSANNNTILANANYGLAKLVRATTPANKLDVSATGEAGLDFDNIKNATGAHTLTNITVPTCTTNSDMVGTNGANTTVPDAAGTAATPAEVATALTNIHLDHLLAANYDPASKPGVATALLNELVENDGGVSRYTANALENAPSGTGASADTIAVAVWNKNQVDHTGAGTFGIIASEIAAIPTTAEFEARSDLAGTAATPAEVATALSNINLDHLCKTATGGANMTDEVADNTILSRILSNGDTSIFDPSTDGLQPIRDRGDAEWVTGGGGAAPTVGEIRTEMEKAGTKLTFALADTNELQSNQGNFATATGFATEIKQDIIDTNIDQIEAAVITNAAGVDVAADIIAVKAETASILTDTGTTLQGELDGIQADTEDIQSRLPAALSSGNIKADVLAISTSTVAADNLEASAETIIPTSVNDAAASTTAFVTNLASAVDDFYNGRLIIFTSGALANQATDITDYAGATKTVTVTALTAAPANSATFVVV